MKIQRIIFLISIEAAALLALIGCGTISSSEITFTPKSSPSILAQTQTQPHEITIRKIISKPSSPS
jgi:hypothetical protein